MAKNSLSKGGAGGRPSSKALGKPTQYFVGQPSQRVAPGGADQLGQAMSNRATDSGKVLRNPATPMISGNLVRPGQPEMGNTLAVATVCGVGGSRTIVPTGGQAQHGPVAGTPKPQGREILRDFGPDVPGRK
jgi:hypothetical protein